jgi:hypothetical protein
MAPNEINHYQQNNEQMNTLIVEIDSLRAENVSLRAEIVSLRAEIVSLRAENVSLRGQNQRQNNQNESEALKILYYLPDKETPYRSSFKGSTITLKQFKLLINLRGNFK